MNGHDAVHALGASVAATPLAWAGLTLLAFAAGEAAHRRSGASPLVNPILIAVALIGGTLALLGIDYETYLTGGRLLQLLLPAATVALAVPMARHISLARGRVGALLAGVICGSACGLAVTVGVALLLGASSLTLVSLAPRSTTMAVSVEVARLIHGLVPLTALATLITGILGATFGVGLLQKLGVRDPRALGLALGTGSHALGTARALTVSETVGAFSAFGLVANALLTAAACRSSAALPRPWDGSRDQALPARRRPDLDRSRWPGYRPERCGQCSLETGRIADVHHHD